MELSQRCLEIAPSLTLEIDARAKRMRAEGIDVIGLGAGEPDFDTPEYIKDAAREALDSGMTKYTPAAGTLDFRTHICEKLRKDNGLEYQPSQIIVSNGAKHSLFNTFAAMINPGDEVIIPAPYWVTYPEIVKYLGGVPVFVQTREEDGFVPRAEAVQAAVTPRTKAILINSPSNPCGAVISRRTLSEIAAVAKEADCFIVSDEIYEKLVYDGQKHISVASVSADAYERTVVVNGLSKAFAMTGWRLGYTAANPVITKAMSNLQSQMTSNANSIAQHAGAIALTNGESEIAQMVGEFSRRRLHMCECINRIEGISCRVPFGAFYVMMKISGIFGKKYGDTVINDSLTFVNTLLESEKVAVVPGAAFGSDDYCRLSYATSYENVTSGAERIGRFVSALR